MKLTAVCLRTAVVTLLLVTQVCCDKPTAKTTQSGEKLLLICNTEGTSERRTWSSSLDSIISLDDRIIHSGHRFQLPEVALTEYHLQITYVIESDDEVVFTCKEGNIIRASYQLHVQMKPKMISSTSSPIVVSETENDTLTLWCNVTGNPHPNITWYRQGTNTTETRPSIIGPASSPATVLAAENDTLTLWCNVTGKPRPTVTWYRQRTATQARESTRVVGGVLTIHKVTRYLSDTYICLARNKLGTAERRIGVKVNFTAVSVDATEVKAVPDVDAVLACVVQSEPFIAAYWIDKMGRQLSRDYYSWDYKVIWTNYPLYKMTILTLTVNHNGMENRTGTYVCHAEGNTVVEKAVTIT